MPLILQTKFKVTLIIISSSSNTISRSSSSSSSTRGIVFSWGLSSYIDDIWFLGAGMNSAKWRYTVAVRILNSNIEPQPRSYRGCKEKALNHCSVCLRQCFFEAYFFNIFIRINWIDNTLFSTETNSWLCIDFIKQSGSINFHSGVNCIVHRNASRTAEQYFNTDTVCYLC